MRPEYGVLYEHIGQLYQGLQRYYLVIGIPLPTERDMPDAYTDVTINCNYHTFPEYDQMLVRDLMRCICVLTSFLNFHTQTSGHISLHTRIDEVIKIGDHNITKRSLGDIVKIVSRVVKGQVKLALVRVNQY